MYLPKFNNYLDYDKYKYDNTYIENELESFVWRLIASQEIVNIPLGLLRSTTEGH